MELRRNRHNDGGEYDSADDDSDSNDDYDVNIISKMAAREQQQSPPRRLAPLAR